jgi:GNAT superfamily N-acetyltransferase
VVAPPDGDARQTAPVRQNRGMTDASALPISIRNAEPGDLVTVAELRWQWVLENEGTPVVSHEEFLAFFAEWARTHRASHSCTVARRGDTVIGMAWLAIVPRVPSSRAPVRASGDVQCVYVVPAERDAGVGGRMLAAVLAHASEAGLERVTVQSTPGAVTAYERAGFAASARLLQAPPAP